MAVAGLVLVACGPAASQSTSQSTSQSSAPSQAAQSSGDVVGPSFTTGAAADLEALIPGTAGGVTLTKASMRGSDYLVSGNADPATVKFLQDLGVSPNDISMAYGIGFSADASSTVAMFVFRAAGANSAQLLSAFKTASEADSSSPLQWASANVGGKQVEASSGGSETTYLYVKGDVLFFVGASDPAVAAGILNGLP
jgi:hypothetical protein